MDKTQENSNIVPSGYRILYVLLLLANKELSQKEISIELERNPDIEQAFTKETVLKIINTLKVADISISKKKNKYFISKLPWFFDFKAENLNTLPKLGEFTSSLGQKELLKNYNSFLLNVFRYLPEEKLSDIRGHENKKSSKYQDFLHLIRKLEQAKKNNYRIKIIFDDESLVFDSFNIEYTNSDVFINGYNVKSHENKIVNIRKIKNIRQLPQKSSGVFFPSNVTFKIKGKLAKSYNLRENEKLIFFDNEQLIISNKGEDKEKLLLRLMKYKDLCEIIAPESFRSDFVNILKDTISAYKML